MYEITCWNNYNIKINGIWGHIFPHGITWLGAKLDVVTITFLESTYTVYNSTLNIYGTAMSYICHWTLFILLIHSIGRKGQRIVIRWMDSSKNCRNTHETLSQYAVFYTFFV